MPQETIERLDHLYGQCDIVSRSKSGQVVRCAHEAEYAATFTSNFSGRQVTQCLCPEHARLFCEYNGLALPDSK